MLKFAVKRKPVELFHEAVHNRDIARVKILLQHNRSHFDIDDVDADGITALQRCCFTGSLKLVQLLVACGADFNIQDKDGWSVMHAAAIASNYSIMRYLIAMGAQVGLQNDQGELAIDLARDVQSVVILAEAMRRTGRAKDVETFFERRPEVRELLEERLQQSNLAETAPERPRAASEILASNIRPTEGPRRCSLDIIKERHIPAANVMMDEEGSMDASGVSLPSKSPPKSRLKTVCPKCGKRRQEVFKRRSIVSLSSTSSDSSSSSDSAYSSGSTNSGANFVSSETAKQRSPPPSEISFPSQLRVSSEKGIGHCLISSTELGGILQPRKFSFPSPCDEAMVPRIANAIKEVGNINELKSSGLSLLHEAAAKGDTEGVKLLLKHGAEVNRQSLNGNSPLHEAVREGNVVTASILIEYGADLFAETDNGKLPVELAKDPDIKCFIESAMAVR